MFHHATLCRDAGASAMTALLAHLAEGCSRPRYAFMLLSLLADIARPDGSAGPLVARDDGLIPLREWLCAALSPMADRNPKRRALAARVAQEMAIGGGQAGDEASAAARLEEEVQARILASGKSNVSRTVSELVRAGLLRRHYQGYRVDHENRGAQRQAVYILTGAARVLLSPAPPPVAQMRLL